MAKFIYNGPPSGVTLPNSGGHEGRARQGEASIEVLLFPGREVELPETNPYVKSLIAQGRLVKATNGGLSPADQPKKENT